MVHEKSTRIKTGLFRRQFIDPKMPGYKADPAEVEFGKALVARLRLMISQAGKEENSVPARASAFSSRQLNGSPDAV